VSDIAVNPHSSDFVEELQPSLCFGDENNQPLKHSLSINSAERVLQKRDGSAFFERTSGRQDSLSAIADQ
jgi:hypothetical protein